MSVWFNPPFCDCGDCSICGDQYQGSQQQMNDLANQAYTDMCNDAMKDREHEYWMSVSRSDGGIDLLDIIATGKNAYDVIMLVKKNRHRDFYLAYIQGMVDTAKNKTELQGFDEWAG